MSATATPQVKFATRSLADIAATDDATFAQIVERAKEALAAVPAVS